jgi:glycosyltransferase involved in cell wall biosynthesis
MSQMPLITVYVPCRNYGRFLRQCVESVFAQLYAHWELFIIDEGSTDETEEVGQELARMRPENTTFIRHPRPVGLQKLANMILRRAKGKYMMRLDADDWLDESALLIMVSKLESSPEVGMVYGNYFYVASDGTVLGMERRNKLGHEDKVGHLPPHGACTMFRTRSLKAVGGYSEDVNAQDGWELWYKLNSRIGSSSLDTPLFYYRQHEAALTRNHRRLLDARTQIFEKIAANLDGDYKPVTIAVIPVRESYPGFEGVPYRTFNGISLLERAIISAASAKTISQVLVASQSSSVLEFSAKLEATGKVPAHLRYLRPMADRQDASLPIKDILLGAGKYLSELMGAPPDILAYLSLHAVHRRNTHIDNAINILRINESDSVASVQEEREPMFCLGKTGLKLLNPGRFDGLSFDREKLFQFNGSIIATWWEVLQANDLLGENISFIEMSSEDSYQIKNMEMLTTNANQ